MNTYISILRGINVSGHNMIKMDALKRIYAGLACNDVQTYIQSGNVVFRTKGAAPEMIEMKIRAAIKKEFGFDVPVMVIDLNDMKKIVKENPFTVDTSKDHNFLHVSFLSGDPGKTLINKIDGAKYLPDEFRCKGRAIYLYCPGGYGKTKLNNGFFENKLKITATTRNWKTVNELVRIAEDI